MENDVFNKIGFVIDVLERRLTALEAENAALREKVACLDATEQTHDQSITNLDARLTHESLSILDVIDDMQAKLNPLFDRFNPWRHAFNGELRQVLQARRSRG